MAISNFEQRHKDLVQRVEYMFGKKAPILPLWQEIAENFYPQRADFTMIRSPGDEFADHLSTSGPVMACRDLQNSLSGMLRPAGITWLHLGTDKPDELVDNAAQQWLQRSTRIQYKAMTDADAQMARATSETDHDFVAFGQGVISVEVNHKNTSLLYRNWHLRDMVWTERFDGSIGLRARKWKPCAVELMHVFGDKVHTNIKQAIERKNGVDAYKEFECLHIMVPADEYEYKKSGQYRVNFPFISVYIDLTNKHVMEEMPYLTGYYVIPRWQTMSGTQYAVSPATMSALPDARLLQAITFTLLKAGEKAVDPPMIATQDTIKSPIDIQAGGVTFVDFDYDERLGEALRPMSIDSRSIPVGLNMQDRVQATINGAFYLDKLRLPPMMPETTAFEIAQRLREYVRQALPLFGPIEREYNSPLCEDTFTLLMTNNAFGSPAEIPQSLQGSEIRFRFDSPLVDADDQQLVQAFQDSINMSSMAAAMDPAAGQMLDVQVALRDTYRGRQVPATWVKDEETMAELTAAQQQKQQAMETAAMIQQGGMAAEQVGMAQQALAPAESK